VSTVKPEVQRVLDERDKCRKDKLYLSQIMGYDFVETVHAELFQQFITYNTSQPWATQSETKKRLILWPRGHFKTTAVIVDIVQIILNFPDVRILIMQGSLSTTQTLLHQIKSHFTGENSKSRIPELFPEFCADKLGNADAFTVPARVNKGLAQATVTVASPRKVKTGQHYDIGFFDDLVNDQNYTSAKLLEKVRKDFFMCLPLIDPPHYAVISGTRYAFGDLYEQIMRANISKEWKVSLKDCWTDDSKDLPLEKKIPRFLYQLKPSSNGTEYMGFTRDGLIALQLADPAMFNSQYLNIPIQRGGKRFPKELLESCLIHPAEAPALSDAVLFVDLAATDREGSDDSVIICGKHDRQMTQYVVDGRGGQWLPPVLAQNVIEMALRHRPAKILFEKTASCIYFVDYLRIVARQYNIFLPVDFIKVDNRDGAKDIRIGGLETFLKTKRLRFFIGLSIWEKMTEQFDKWSPGGTSNRHDDYPDTVGHMAHTFGGEALLQPLQRVVKDPVMAAFAQLELQSAGIVTAQEPDESDGFSAF
jgi:hypothetical protein